MEEVPNRSNGESDSVGNQGSRGSAVEQGAAVATQSQGDGLSGVVRSSLDLVCPPPTGDEGATFQLGHDEQRQSAAAQCVVVGSSGREEGVEGVQEQEEGGLGSREQVEVGGGEGEGGRGREDVTEVTGEPSGEGNTETGGDGRDTRKTRSRKVSNVVQEPKITFSIP